MAQDPWGVAPQTEPDPWGVAAPPDQNADDPWGVAGRQAPAVASPHVNPDLPPPEETLNLLTARPETMDWSALDTMTKKLPPVERTPSTFERFHRPVTQIPAEAWDATKKTALSAAEDLGPANYEKMREEQKNSSPFNPMPQINQIGRFGRGMLSAASIPFAPFMGAANSLIGYPYAEAQAALRGVTPDSKLFGEAKEAVETSMMAVRPSRGGLKVAPKAGPTLDLNVAAPAPKAGPTLEAAAAPDPWAVKGDSPMPSAPRAPTPDERLVLDRVAPPEKQPLPTPNEMYRDYVDDQHLLKKATEAMTNGVKLDTVFDPYDLARLTRGSGGKAQHAVNHGTFDFSTFEVNGPALKEILAPVKNDTDRFKAYIMAKRAVELDARGIETGIDIPAAKRIIASQNDPSFEKAAQGLTEFQHKTLDYLRDSGMLSAEVADKMKDLNAAYIPFHRLLDPEVPLRGPGANLQAAQPVKGIKGSDKLILDPIESMIRNTYTYMANAEKNRVNNALVNLMEKSPVGGEFGHKVPTKTRPVEVAESEVAAWLRDHNLPEELAEPLTVFRAANQKNAPNEITVWRDGKAETWEVKPEIAQAVKGLDEQMLGGIMKALSKPASWLRAGAVLDPAYILRNPTRDQLTAFVQSKNGYKPFLDLFRGMVQIGTKGEGFKDWLKGGGAQAALVAMDRDYAGYDFMKLGRDRTLLQKAKNVITSPLEVLRTASETMENATRIGEFMRAQKGDRSARSTMRAALDARNVTQDFSRVGAQMRGMNAITAFMNANIQGTDRMVQSYRERKAETLLKLAAGITAPSFYLWMANRGDPRWENAPHWEKDMFWFILDQKDKNAEPVKIPKPFTQGMLFGSLPERMLSQYFDKNPKAYDAFAKNLLGSVTPNFIPTAVVPPLEHMTNYSTFYGTPLVSKRNQNLMPAEQSTPGSTELSKRLGRGISKLPWLEESSFASPQVLDNYIRGWTGGLGTGFVKNAVDPLLEKISPSGAPEAPEAKNSDRYILRSFTSRYPSANMQPIQDFYEGHDRMEKLVRTAKELERKGDEAGAKAYNARVTERTVAIKRQMDKLNAEVRETQVDRTMTPAEKRVKIDNAYFRMLKLAQDGNKALAKPEGKQEPLTYGID